MSSFTTDLRNSFSPFPYRVGHDLPAGLPAAAPDLWIPEGKITKIHDGVLTTQNKELIYAPELGYRLWQRGEFTPEKFQLHTEAIICSASDGTMLRSLRVYLNTLDLSQELRAAFLNTIATRSAEVPNLPEETVGLVGRHVFYDDGYQGQIFGKITGNAYWRDGLNILWFSEGKRSGHIHYDQIQNERLRLNLPDLPENNEWMSVTRRTGRFKIFGARRKNALIKEKAASEFYASDGIFSLSSHL